MVCRHVSDCRLQLCSQNEWLRHAQRHTRLPGNWTRYLGAECYGARRYHFSCWLEAQYGLLGVRRMRSHWLCVWRYLLCPLITIRM